MRVDRPLDDRVCLVTGATRGAGLAIATAPGEYGATVYVTGRSRRGAPTTDGLPGTVEDAADAVTAAGGRGVGLACDHAVDADVEAVVTRIRADHGRLDVVVANAWGGYEGHDGEGFTAPLWEQPIARRWDAMFGAGVRATMTTLALAAPLLLVPPPTPRPRLAIATVAWAYGAFLGSVPYDAAKAAIVRLAFGLDQELRPHGAAAIAVAPGFMRTERVLDVAGRVDVDLSGSETPAYLGRAVRALAAQPDVAPWAGRVVTAGELARALGFTDVDGSKPEPFRLPGP